MTDYDSPWKEALALFFREFLAFYFPEAHAAIDWTRGYEILDQELRQVVRDAEGGLRVVDCLVKVWLLSGEEEWLLIHVEIQSQPDADFTTRLYTCNYRLYDRYQRTVITLAVLADERENWKPDHYAFALWGFRVRMDFPTVKLLEIVRTRPDLETDPNPFAALTLAHVRNLQTKHDPDERRAWKFRLVKSLYQRGMSADTVRALFRCIDWMMDLPKESEALFWDDVTNFEKENKMPFIDIATQKGMERGYVESIKTLWTEKFGEPSTEIQEELNSLHDLTVYQRILKATASAATVDDIRKIWKSNQ